MEDICAPYLASSIALSVAFGRALNRVGIPKWRDFAYWTEWEQHTVGTMLEFITLLGLVVTFAPYGVVPAAVGSTIASKLISLSCAYIQPFVMRSIPSSVKLTMPSNLEARPKIGSFLLLGFIVPFVSYLMHFFLTKVARESVEAAAFAVGLCGGTFLLFGDTLSSLESFELFGALLLDRVFNSVGNWVRHPVRSAVEISVWLASIYLSQDLSPLKSVYIATSAAAGVILLNHLRFGYRTPQPRVPAPVRAAPAAAPNPTVPEADRLPGEMHCRTREGYPVIKDAKNRVLRTSVTGTRGWVGVHGKWYDVEAFTQYHPGGTVLAEFYGKDATLQFEAFHRPSVINRFRPVGEYELDIEDELERDFLKLAAEFWRDGWYDVPLAWYVGKVVFLLSLISCTALIVLFAGEPTHTVSDVFDASATQAAWWAAVQDVLLRYVAPGICLGFFWQQSGFLTHDLMHNSIFQDRKIDQAHGWFWGNVCMGLSSQWWHDEHFEHHYFTNTVIPGVMCSDPQQFEQGVFMQHEMLAPFMPHPAARFVIMLQQYTFLPIMFLVGRFAICIASYTMQRGRNEWIGVGIHWAWLLTMFSSTSFWRAFTVWYIASMVQGLLALQLCLSHYDKPFEAKEEVKSTWARRQATVTKDITCPWYWDWIHGGLNLHIVHHMFPKLPRARFRQGTVRIMELLKKHNVEADTASFPDATKQILSHLDHMAYFVPA
ncbi:Sphingolipid 10-desaturase [Diplonema papillatum]|nr:Sphingolipid 10-desaturase [Diplonema papillatum]KAJ9462743.1 Sphingolipid 10-desaturase [Diplonema papillatum]|eukprot:gene21444-32988_t